MPSQRHSLQREKIYETVRATDRHPTAETVYASLKQDLPRLSLGTVYRNLQQMAQEGRLQRLEGQPVRFDACLEPHSHFCCVACGLLLDAPAVGYDAGLDRAAERSGFRVARHELCFYGICPACAGEHIQESMA